MAVRRFLFRKLDTITIPFLSWIYVIPILSCSWNTSFNFLLARFSSAFSYFLINWLLLCPSFLFKHEFSSKQITTVSRSFSVTSNFLIRFRLFSSQSKYFIAISRVERIDRENFKNHIYIGRMKFIIHRVLFIILYTSPWRLSSFKDYLLRNCTMTLFNVNDVAYRRKKLIKTCLPSSTKKRSLMKRELLTS